MRLIDAEALKTKILILLCEVQKHGFTPPEQIVNLGLLLQYIDNAPTIEAKPIVHAHWDEVSGGRTTCTNCGNYPLYDYFGRLKFSDICPHCGALMDENHIAEVGKKEGE